ncbi:hypothetical protein H072_1472 [Dactylellina haptotyla CBS 200.50]|uniref:Cytoplasmic tRNA 2-thiolation protein 2 n=1 Tax=Dactylellina haptotyla (strain CBS 200.50) TaxID=1284197 RepID=S8CA28_DACHA|nr:hypothetical protein H072_1472 [Dactylellina haptotyla CBS 200.50]
MEFEVTMADVAKMPKPAPPAVCIRCKENQPAITIRNEALCSDCFTTFMRTKFTRHMEPYRVKRGTETNRRKIMLANSFGVASTALLDLLHWHRSLQLERARRAEYDVYVVHIDKSAVLGGDEKASEDHLETLRAKYTQFEFVTVPLERIYELGDSTVDKLVSAETSTDSTTSAAAAESTPAEKLKALLSSLNSRASQMDITSLLRTRLMVEMAKKYSCEAILFADSMTKMAAMVLAEVTKGRGHALPWLISDGPTPYGKQTIVRPLRELAKNEVTAYVDFCSLWPFTTTPKETAKAPPKPAVNMKNQTIDEVMGRFFEDISNSHLTANVVKTASKLHFPDDHDRVERLGLCEICGMPMDEDPKIRRIRVTGSAKGEEEKKSGQPSENSSSSILDSDARIYCLEPPPGEEGLKERRCYGCRRSTLGAGRVNWPVSNR